MSDAQEPQKTPEIASISTPFTPPSLALASLLVALLIVFAIFFFNKKKSKSKGNTLLLVGAPDAGKTSILSQLAYKQTLPTQTSMQVNSVSVSLSPTNNNNNANSKSIRVVDVPGHPRLRNQFEEYMDETKAVAFVVDASTISRNAAAVAEHMHQILHALTSLPPSRQPPTLLVLAHKSDLFKPSSASASTTNTTTNINTTTNTLAINRVKTILERELEKRRVSQSGGVNVEGLGEEGAERSMTEMGGLDCGEKEGSAFKFDEWEGGEVVFLGTSVVNAAAGAGAVGGADDEKSGSENNSLESLWDVLADCM